MVGKMDLTFSEPWKIFFQTLEKFMYCFPMVGRFLSRHWKPAGWVFFLRSKKTHGQRNTTRRQPRRERPKDEAAFLCAGRQLPFEAARERNEPRQDRPHRKRGKRCLIHRHQTNIRGFYATIRPTKAVSPRAVRAVFRERIKTTYVGLVLSERLWRLCRHPTT